MLRQQCFKFRAPGDKLHISKVNFRLAFPSPVRQCERSGWASLGLHFRASADKPTAPTRQLWGFLFRVVADRLHSSTGQPNHIGGLWSKKRPFNKAGLKIGKCFVLLLRVGSSPAIGCAPPQESNQPNEGRGVKARYAHHQRMAGRSVAPATGRPARQVNFVGFHFQHNLLIYKL